MEGPMDLCTGEWEGVWNYVGIDEWLGWCMEWCVMDWYRDKQMDKWIDGWGKEWTNVMIDLIYQT